MAAAPMPDQKTTGRTLTQQASGPRVLFIPPPLSVCSSKWVNNRGVGGGGSGSGRPQRRRWTETWRSREAESREEGAFKGQCDVVVKEGTTSMVRLTWRNAALHSVRATHGILFHDRLCTARTSVRLVHLRKLAVAPPTRCRCTLPMTSSHF